MSVQKAFFKSILAKVLAGFLLGAAGAVAAGAQESAARKTQSVLTLGETPVRVNVYEKSGAQTPVRLTFFSPHHNEQTGLKITREAVAARGGRLVEVESLDEHGSPARRLKFAFKGKSYSLDPNRIFTDNGRRCGEFSGEIGEAVERFAAALLKIILAPDGGGNRLREGENFLVAVHNNADVDAAGRTEAERERDLTAHGFAAGRGRVATGAFQGQAAGVYLSNDERDADNFIFLSEPAFLGFFAERGFHVVVQKPAFKLQSGDCGIDDGSLSVFAGQQGISYINLEADAAAGGARQRQMLDAVYELALKTAVPTVSGAKSEAVEGTVKK